MISRDRIKFASYNAYPNEKKEVGEGSDAESKRDEQHEHPDKYHAPGRSTRNLTDAEDKAAAKIFICIV